VSVAEKPKSENLFWLGRGFAILQSRISADHSFTLVVVGKNRHDKASSTVQITVSKQSSSFAASSASSADRRNTRLLLWSRPTS
jgi:hypothetical protein